MADIINDLQENLLIKTKIADNLHATFDKLQLSIFSTQRITLVLLHVEEDTQMT